MRRGDVYWVDFEPSVGSEADKVRPAVVVSNDGANRAVEGTGSGVVTVIPLTRSVARIYPFQTMVPAGECGLSTHSKAQAEQVRSVAPERLHERLGRVSPATLSHMSEALRLHLAL